MLENIDIPDKRKDATEKKLLADLLKSKVYRPSSKPWEAVKMDTFLSWKTVTKPLIDGTLSSSR